MIWPNRHMRSLLCIIAITEKNALLAFFRVRFRICLVPYFGTLQILLTLTLGGGKVLKKENIILIGFMGCGKTTVGLRLSYVLRKIIQDTDKMIEKQEDKPISDIFAEDGEQHFRMLETKLLERLVETAHNQILSVGGGTPLKEENRILLKQIGTVIYLRIQPETVYERLKDDDTRPLLQGPNPLAKITEIMNQRKAVYEGVADIIIDVDELDMEDILEKILYSLRKNKAKRKQL